EWARGRGGLFGDVGREIDVVADDAAPAVAEAERRRRLGDADDELPARLHVVELVGHGGRGKDKQEKGRVGKGAQRRAHAAVRPGRFAHPPDHRFAPGRNSSVTSAFMSGSCGSMLISTKERDSTASAVGLN